ncbi:MAG: hypothetical protein AB7Q81_24055 [Gammaproteobacteria bacterium]
MGSAISIALPVLSGAGVAATVHTAGMLLPQASLGARMLSRVFPACNWCTPAIRELLEAEPAFALELLRRGEAAVHVLALAHLAPERLPRSAHDRAQLFVTTGYRHIVGRIAGLPVALVPVLGKLGQRPLRRDCYELLVGLVARDEIWRRLRHFRRIEPEQIRLLAELPPAYAGAAIVRRVRHERERRFVLSAIHIAEALRGTAARPRLAASLARVPDFKALHAWVRGIHTMEAFPPPPWPGSTRLQPVTTGAALAALALEFANCAGAFVDEVYAGQMYFYRWSDPRHPVLVAIRRDTYFGWVIHDIKGPRNRPVASPRTNAIKQELGGSGMVNVHVDSTVLDRWEF